MSDTRRLIALDKAHVWHPFTFMRQWRDGVPNEPLVIVAGEGEFLIDSEGNRYIDGVSSLWCNVHGHRVPAIDDAIRQQLDKIAHSTLLGLAGEKSIELAAKLIALVNNHPSSVVRRPPSLNKVFYSDAGATAVEAALKMAVGYWHHTGKPAKNRFIAFAGGYHGDTTGSMSIGYSDLFHRPFKSMVFQVDFAPGPDMVRPPGGEPADRPWKSCAGCGGEAARCSGIWPSECPQMQHNVTVFCLAELELFLMHQGEQTAAVVIEPLVQGAGGILCQPPGFVRAVRDLCDMYNVLLIADEVATGFGRTGKMFACEHESVTPDIMCLGKGITGGYLPLAATLATDQIEQAFCGEYAEAKTLFHGHTYTGNALACAAALASLRLFESTNLLAHINRNAALMAERLNILRDPQKFPGVFDVRQRGLMVGIELCQDRGTRKPLDPLKRTGAALCAAMRPKGLILRPLGDVLVLMPIPAMAAESLHRMMDIVIDTLAPARPT